MQPVIVIPAYEPTSGLVQVVKQLRQARPNQALVIVDDGCSAKTQGIFEQLDGYQVTLIRHATNLGKGQALKTAFNYVLTHHPDAPGIVTADADGQHLCEDILKVSDALVRTPNALWIGARAFDENVPARSQLGNVVTRHVFRLLVGQMVTDTQSGLRGIPSAFAKELLRLSSTRYEFELDMLVEAAQRHLPIRSLPIKTVYIDGNSSSHFRPLVDSLKVYFVFIRFCALSIVTALLDFVVFTLAFWLYPNIFASFITARLVAGTFNFSFGKRLIFKSKANILPEAMKFAALVFFLMLVSYGLVNSMVTFLGMNVFLSKILAEFGLFLLSFAAQRLFVFNRALVADPLG